MIICESMQFSNRLFFKYEIHPKKVPFSLLRGTSVAICAFVKTNLLTIQYSMGAMVIIVKCYHLRATNLDPKAQCKQ